MWTYFILFSTLLRNNFHFFSTPLYIFIFSRPCPPGTLCKLFKFVFISHNFNNYCSLHRYSSFLFIIVFIFIITVNSNLYMHFFVRGCFLYVMNCFPSTSRYFKLELLPKGAISLRDLPPFLSTFFYRTLADCMYTTNQLQMFTTVHLSEGGWYLECHIIHTPPSEVEYQ